MATTIAAHARATEISQQELKLLRAAQSVAKKAYAPYSQFAVGAAVETTDGHVFCAANMENASYGLTACAELGALQATTSAGALHLIKRIAVVGGPMKVDERSAPKPTPPCGRCRQLILEAATLAGRDVEVLFADSALKVVVKRTISELLPDSFGFANLR
jgi:cytidine deaminase